ncbi:MAG: hypothetical protein HYU59_06730 [Magnetospirillum gryphiswaldense]|nr:hypothetical protein [Magnetospirillum gryphiswaldense]
MTTENTIFTDVVNFNADASCLSAAAWLRALEGGESAPVFQWLGLFVQMKKKVVLGLTGATAADMAFFNPHSIRLINDHPDIFQVIARPFSHDAALLRLPDGFRVNFRLGLLTLRRLFSCVQPFFLPPEFMLTVEQTRQLDDDGVVLTFLNPSRFRASQREFLPVRPYLLRGALDSALVCLPVAGELTQAYLSGLDHGDAAAWNRALVTCGLPAPVGWRDGESVLLFPQGIERERRWLDGELCERTHLPVPNPADFAPAGEGFHQTYPMHPFTAWMREFRVMGYVHRLLRLEERLRELDAAGATLWLQCINSDVLSSVEKDTVYKRFASLDRPGEFFDGQFLRTERGFEGSEYLLLLERHLNGDVCDYAQASSAPHMLKLRARRLMIEDVLAGHSLASVIDGGGR